MLSLLVLPFFVLFASAAFTLPYKELSGDAVAQKPGTNTFCYYPSTRTIAKDCVGRSSQLIAVRDVHLNTTVSIGYYDANHSRLGGAEYPVTANPGDHLYLCLSGRSTDGTYYETRCEIATGDNKFGGAYPCQVPRAQDVVTDGCYVPGNTQASRTQSGSKGTSRRKSGAICHCIAPCSMIIFAIMTILQAI